MPNYSGRNWTERGFTIGIGGSASFPSSSLRTLLSAWTSSDPSWTIHPAYRADRSDRARPP